MKKLQINDDMQPCNGLTLQEKKLIKDNARESAQWVIKRFKNKEDYGRYKAYERKKWFREFQKYYMPNKVLEPLENPVIYSDEEAQALFNAPQVSIINADFLLGKGNLLLNEGINNIFTKICSSAGVLWDNATAKIGVGDSTNPENATQTGLQATTNYLYKSMDTGYPTFGTNQIAVWQATYGTNDANFTWNEFTIGTTADNTGVNLCRKVSPQSAKVVGQIWIVQYQVGLS